MKNIPANLTLTMIIIAFAAGILVGPALETNAPPAIIICSLVLNIAFAICAFVTINHSITSREVKKNPEQ